MSKVKTPPSFRGGFGFTDRKAVAGEVTEPPSLCWRTISCHVAGDDSALMT
jgi:hypothetical protein